MILRKIKSIIRQSPFLYFGLFGWRKNVRRLRARRDSELVVEAFPRSANTTSMYALFYAQGSSFKVGHHLHVSAHIKYAVSRDIPCLVIMRNPLDCVASRMVMKKGGVAKDIVKDYIDFSKSVQRLRTKLVIVGFEDVIKEGLGFAIEEVNVKFATDFCKPDASEEEKAWVDQQVRKWNLEKSGGDVERLSIPSDVKKAKAFKMRERIQMEAPDELAVANELYHDLIETKERDE